MKKNPSLLAGLVVASLFAFSAGSPAQDNRVEELERRLQERDKVIIELLERVEALERRLGIEHGSSDPDRTASEAADRPAAERPDADGTAPGTVVVDQRAAERALERSLVRAGALLLPVSVLEIEPAVSYVRRESAAPRFVSSGAQLLAAETRRNADDLGADVALRLGLPWDSQVEIGLPYRWRHVEDVTRVGFSPSGTVTREASAFGDLRLGLAKTLLRERGMWPDLVARLSWDTATGKGSDDGVSLGGGFHELRGSLTAIKRQDPMAFIGGLAYTHTLEDGQVQPGSAISGNFGTYIAMSPETSLRFLVSGTYQVETQVSGSRIGGSDRTFGTFVVGGSTLLAPGTLMNLSLGIGLTEDADDFSLSLSIPFRLDGPW